MEESTSRLQLVRASPGARIVSFARVAALAALLWAVVGQVNHSYGTVGWPVILLMTATSVGWAGWLLSAHLDAPLPVLWGFLALLAGAGGALAAYAPIAITFVAVAGLGAAVALDIPQAVAVGAIGVAALVAALLALNVATAGEIVAEGALSAFAGLMVGYSRRQYLDRAAQAEQLLAERTRADAEHDKATALAERNRLGRELHDVLAHSLGALSVQLDAADALLEQGDDPDKARRMVRQARQLAVEGLSETRQAVHALRDEPVELAEQLTSLAGREGAAITVHGRPRRLDPETGLALYRVAQEALTNARKHAPGARVSIDLDFEAGATVLEVANGASPDANGARADLKDTGGGFGLRGMRDRIELVGGDVRAEPNGAGWTVHAAVPA